MKIPAVAAALLLCTLTACGSADKNANDRLSSTTDAATTTATPAPPAPAPFAMSSTAFADNTPIPAEFSCNGRNVPPPLRWENVPAGTESLALVVDDPDAVGGLYIHWIVTGIPPSAAEIVDGVLPPGTQVGLNSGGQAAYLGPCPPAGTGVHHYRFQLYAIGKPLAAIPATPAADAARSIAGAAIADARVVGVFGG
ncbi:MAG: YbhB/YbcL family Raf kinase inhibitor-like protein [Mycobacterium sp.]